jgi:hypothetical protein
MDNTTRSVITMLIIACELGFMYYVVTHAEQIKYWIQEHIIDKIPKP